MHKLPRVAAAVATLGASAAVLDVVTDGGVRRFARGAWHTATGFHQIAFVARHLDDLWLYSAARSASTQAEAGERQLFGRHGTLDAEGDAFRHAYASALLTLDAIRNHGKSPAQARALVIEAGEAHEADGTDNTHDAHKMDLHNNRVGAELVADGRDADGAWLDAADVRARVLDALRGGRLVRLQGPDIVPTTGSELLRA